jgi:hypothetical protein
MRMHTCGKTSCCAKAQREASFIWTQPDGGSRNRLAINSARRAASFAY